MLDCYISEDQIFIVLEFMQGGELFERICEKEFYSEKEALNVLSILLDALNYCHSKGIIHRDLKPENILYESDSDNSVIKIADFGVSKVLNNPKELISTIIGSPSYQAPEMLEGKKYTAKCDIYALGNIFYTTLCGFPPFDDEEENYK